MSKISRKQYVDLFGPTVGDKIRLGDTELYVEIERDLRTYGDEAVYGGGKTLRDGMGLDNQLTSAAGALDLVITNATIIDPTIGVVKADVGVKDGKIVGIGKAGNPSTMEGVTPNLAVGPATDAISAEHLILTPAGMDAHIHLISPQQVYAALSNGVTTFFGGGIGPTDGTNGTTITSGPWNLEMMFRSIEGLPINFGLLGKGNSSGRAPLVEQVLAGAAGFKIHEDWGTTPACIRACLEVADDMDVQVSIHTDTLNESGYVEDTIAAEGVLHDMGLISIISSDSQAMGRVGETFLRAIQTADHMKKVRGPLPEDAPGNDNFRVLRFVAKVTINPAITQGIGHVLGSIAPGKLADLVLWEPAFFGAKPKMVIKGGMINWASMGDPNASLPTPQPMLYRPMFGAFGDALHRSCITFTSKAGHDSGLAERFGLRRKVMPVYGTRTLTKRDMVRNDTLAKIEVDPQTFAVKVNGQHATAPPAKKLALNQLYFFS